MCIYRERERETSNMLFYTDTNKTEPRQKKMFVFLYMSKNNNKATTINTTNFGTTSQRAHIKRIYVIIATIKKKKTPKYLNVLFCISNFIFQFKFHFRTCHTQPFLCFQRYFIFKRMCVNSFLSFCVSVYLFFCFFLIIIILHVKSVVCE